MKLRVPLHVANKKSKGRSQEYHLLTEMLVWLYFLAPASRVTKYIIGKTAIHSYLLWTGGGSVVESAANLKEYLEAKSLTSWQLIRELHNNN